MKLFTPFTIPQKDNCDLCRIEKNKKNKLRIYVQINFLNSSSRALKNASSEMTEKRRFSQILKLGLNNSWNDPACYSVVNNCSKETHHRQTAIHLFCCFPVVICFIHYTKPGMIWPVVRYAPIRARQPTEAARPLSRSAITLPSSTLGVSVVWFFIKRHLG